MKLNALAISLSQLDPRAVLARGYALVIGPDGRAIRDATTVNPGDTLQIDLARGRIEAGVRQVVPAPEAD